MTAVVHAGRTTTLQVMLESETSEFERLMMSGNFWGWTAGGAGTVALITSIALLSYASSLSDDIDELNKTHTSGYTDYERQYDALAADMDT